ncbi:peroxisomal sarcosine oxidase isoform X2 [Sorex fumeus]|uniref:peroxisomal sarcosine oxidase isoform X2 n=1 Tax=Sorex fumeus TaxID=62283 RepID=UPI0024ADAAA1|nr:peroxisomal sarcosine oxidase isoform X2 [Sorex fumeus]
MAAQHHLYDAVVIGAGIQGCFTAYHLAKHKKKVLLLEQFFLPHSRGSSHGQSRIIRRAYPEDFYTNMMDECYKMWAQLEHETGTQLHRQTGFLLLGMKENPELKTIKATLARHGVEHQWLQPEELKQHFPNMRPASGETGLLDESGGILYADKALRALQNAIQQLGGIVRDGEKVLEIKPGQPVTVTTPSGSYQGKSLIITAGPWTNRLLRPLGAELPLQTLRINVCYWREKVPGSYGAAFPCFLSLERSLGPHHVYGLPSREYPGMMKNTPDEHFVLDRHPKYDNIIIGAGFSGHGFKLSPVVGKILYELSMKLTPSYDLTPFRISRFPSLGRASL